jgi:hypothetical protein
MTGDDPDLWPRPLVADTNDDLAPRAVTECRRTRCTDCGEELSHRADVDVLASELRAVARVVVLLVRNSGRRTRNAVLQLIDDQEEANR